MKTYLLVAIILFLFSCQKTQEKKVSQTRQAVEYLVFEVKPELKDRFIEAEHQIWTKILDSFPGLISKEIWINDLKPNEVTVVIYWNSFEEWKAIPEEVLKEVEQEFDDFFGEENYSFKEARHENNRWYKVSEYK